MSDSQTAAVLQGIARIANSALSDSSKLRRFLWRYEHIGEDLEDIIQDAMLQAVRCSDRFLGRSSIETWFFGIAANVARNHVASSVRRASKTCSLDDLQERSSSYFETLGSTDSDLDPSKITASRELMAALSKATARLPSELRETFELACVQEIPYQEVAERLTIPIGTVRSRIHRARRIVRLILGEQLSNS